MGTIPSSSHLLFCELALQETCSRILAAVLKAIIMLAGAIRAVKGAAEARRLSGGPTTNDCEGSS